MVETAFGIEFGGLPAVGLFGSHSVSVVAVAAGVGSYRRLAAVDFAKQPQFSTIGHLDGIVAIADFIADGSVSATVLVAAVSGVDELAVVVVICCQLVD